ncbi:MAG TPA: GlsB/YeaQ/YmgE family stress response membrane protein [Ktedonobacterales bacterium]
MNILAWIIIGGLAGLLAGVVIRGSGLGIVGDIILGIVGAFVGGVIFSLFGSTGFTGFNLWSLLVAFVGAVVLLLIVKAINGSGYLGRRRAV